MAEPKIIELANQIIAEIESDPETKEGERLYGMGRGLTTMANQIITSYTRGKLKIDMRMTKDGLKEFKRP